MKFFPDFAVLTFFTFVLTWASLKFVIPSLRKVWGKDIFDMEEVDPTEVFILIYTIPLCLLPALVAVPLWVYEAILFFHLNTK